MSSGKANSAANFPPLGRGWWFNQPLEIIGVAPAGFSGPEVGPNFDVALPLCSRSILHYGDTASFDRRDYSWLNVMGRLKPGWTVARAAEHLRAVSQDLMKTSVGRHTRPDRRAGA